MVAFNAPRVSSDGGGVLLARLDRRLGYLARFAAGFTDYRDAESIEHSTLELLRQRVYGIAGIKRWLLGNPANRVVRVRNPA